MTPALERRIALLDVVGIPLFLECYIWSLQFRYPLSWIVFPVWLIASFLVHRDSPQTLGWRADNLGSACLRAAKVLGVISALLFLVGLALGAPLSPPHQVASLHHLFTYFAFCLLQQVALNSLLTNRLLSLLSDRWQIALMAGAIFSAAHWPNPVLVPATFIGGTALAWLFARDRNILPLALGQAILGSLVWWAFPLSWHHSLRVGPAYYFPF
jgi:hypothetical protein